MLGHHYLLGLVMAGSQNLKKGMMKLVPLSLTRRFDEKSLKRGKSVS